MSVSSRAGITDGAVLAPRHLQVDRDRQLEVGAGEAQRVTGQRQLDTRQHRQRTAARPHCSAAVASASTSTSRSQRNFTVPAPRCPTVPGPRIWSSQIEVENSSVLVVRAVDCGRTSIRPAQGGSRDPPVRPPSSTARRGPPPGLGTTVTSSPAPSPAGPWISTGGRHVVHRLGAVVRHQRARDRAICVEPGRRCRRRVIVCP